MVWLLSSLCQLGSRSHRELFAGTWPYSYYLGTLEFNERDLRKGEVGILGQNRSVLRSRSKQKWVEFREYICRTACWDKHISISKNISRLVFQQSPPDLYSFVGPMGNHCSLHFLHKYKCMDMHTHILMCMRAHIQVHGREIKGVLPAT